ncbi:hypothetical protein PISL3812_09559 [Talaromyces islandicus]|uniref:Uncharacterized protein n=1 Tax=Talaromyces islandicus TaxID=28573 RepID=A0A0U1MA87_TALIS|nr:hypothetical protein PISL3812_09559 [Talaromyces islandicus]
MDYAQVLGRSLAVTTAYFLALYYQYLHSINPSRQHASLLLIVIQQRPAYGALQLKRYATSSQPPASQDANTQKTQKGSGKTLQRSKAKGLPFPPSLSNGARAVEKGGGQGGATVGQRPRATNPSADMMGQGESKCASVRIRKSDTKT